MIVFFILGIILGSFFNVVGWRMPKNIPFHKGRSYCPQCLHPLKWYELIPIVSFLIQHGKCRYCHRRISVIYPIVESITGLLFIYCYMRIGVNVEIITALCLVSMLMIILVSDMHYMLIPNHILLLFLLIFIMLQIILPLRPWCDALIGGMIGFTLIAIIIIISKGGMGAGDMKLFGVLGIVLGWKKLIIAFFLATLLGAIIGGCFMLIFKMNKQEPIAFGPYIALGTLLSYFYGEQFLTLYLTLL